MIESTLFSLLSSLSAVSDLVGARIYPVVLPTDPTLPALTYRFVANTSNPTFGTSGPQRARVELRAWGETYGAAVTLREALIAALNGYGDGSITVLLLGFSDGFDADLLQFCAPIEFYVFFT